MCFAAGRIREATVADHIEPHNGDLKKFNGSLQSLCIDCHNNTKQKIERGIHAVVGEDGWCEDFSEVGGGVKMF